MPDVWRDNPFICCARCGDRIGAYERHVWQAPDGSVVPSGSLTHAGTAPPADWRPYHESCFATGPGSSGLERTTDGRS